MGRNEEGKESGGGEKEMDGFGILERSTTHADNTRKQRVRDSPGRGRGRHAFDTHSTSKDSLQLVADIKVSTLLS